MTDLIPSIPPGYGALGVLAMLIIAWLKLRPAMQKIKSDDDQSLRGDLMTRVRTLEENLITERRDCDAKLEAIQTRSDSKIQSIEATCDAKLKEMQERLDMLMDALLASKKHAYKED